MVRYYGRAKTRTGSVNTNQIGLKMSGSSSQVGRGGYLNNYIGRRVQSNQKVCGPIRRHGVIYRWNNFPCVAKCGNTCKNKLDPLTAVRILQSYLKTKYNGEGTLILVAKKETLAGDGVNDPDLFTRIKHFYRGASEYNQLPPQVQAAADVLNNLHLMGSIKENGPSVLHVAGYATIDDQVELLKQNFGVLRTFGPLKGDSILMFLVCIPGGISAAFSSACAEQAKLKRLGKQADDDNLEDLLSAACSQM